MLWLLIAVALLAAALPALAQETTPEAPDPNANMSWPPPVYVLRGTVEIRGSADLPGMNNYFIEFRALGDDLEADETAIFFPALLPQQTPVVDDVLGEWDTTLTTDGLYELRLTVNIAGADPVIHIVSPLRIENEPPPFVVIATPEVGVPDPAVPTQAAAATTAPVVEATQDNTPRVTVELYDSINVRRGDGTNYPSFNALYNGETAAIVGVSSTGSGWWQVSLPNGQIGWVSPDVVTVLGDTSGVPSVQPPPPPVPTATPVPLPTLAPVTVAPLTQVNLVAGNLYINPNPLVCAETADVGIDVANLGSQAMTSGGTVRVQSIRASDGTVQGTTEGAFGPLQANQTFRVDMRLTISTYYNETHRLVFTIDPNNAIAETVEGDNSRTLEYTLQKGDCP
jgi:uncharacterized protein YgiM (DUF1202 family)